MPSAAISVPEDTTMENAAMRSSRIDARSPNAPNANVANPASYRSHWPANAGYQGTVGNTTARPRSATIAITKNDGGRIGG
jgi:secreted PhoX family phosphatase